MFFGLDACVGILYTCVSETRLGDMFLNTRMAVLRAGYYSGLCD